MTHRQPSKAGQRKPGSSRKTAGGKGKKLREEHVPSPRLLPKRHHKTDDSSALLSSIVESSDDAIVSCTLDGKITSWNAGAEKIFGYSAVEAIGRPTSVLTSATAKDDAANVLRKIRLGQRVDHYETWRRHKDSSDIFVSLTVSPVYDSSGKIVGASKIARDITASHHAEQALRNADKLALAGRMSASIAHEINNPLEAITNLLFLLQQEPISEPGRAYLQLAQSELTRVTRIVSQTLSFFRTATQPAFEDLATAAENALALHAGRLLLSNVSVETAYLAASPLLCHPGEMRQILANLIGNALDAMASKGRLVLRIRPATSTTSGTQGIRLTVADTGSGMTQATQSRLFDPFYTTKGSAGTGLGLWVTRQIVQNHKGRISVRSSQSPAHSGTVFSIFFPYLAAVPAQTGLQPDPCSISPGDESRHTHAALDQPSVAYNAA
ncbi:MAG: PAS domain S-box protein [Acidobacteria bacterium]|nr:PAS domain S-box protein [Acidobacteriota bacterium]